MKKNLIIAFSFLFLSLFFTGNLFAFDVPVTMKITGDYDHTTNMCENYRCMIQYNVNGGTDYEVSGAEALDDSGLSNFLQTGFFIGPFSKIKTNTSQTMSVGIKIVDNSTNASKMNVNVTVPNPNYTGTNGTVGLYATNVEGAAINNSKLSTNAVTTDKIVDNTIGLSDLETNYANCSDGQVLGVSFNSEAGKKELVCVNSSSSSGDVTLEEGQGIDIEQSCGNSVCTNRISVADEGIIDGMIPLNEISGSKILNNSIIGTKYGDMSIGATKLTNNAVITRVLKDFAVTTDKIADGNITTSKIANNAIDTLQIADDAIDYTKIKDGTIRGYNIMAGEIDTDELNAGAVTPIKLDLDYLELKTQSVEPDTCTQFNEGLMYILKATQDHLTQIKVCVCEKDAANQYDCSYHDLDYHGPLWN